VEAGIPSTVDANEPQALPPNAPLEKGKRKYLIIVRAGHNSVHLGWLRGNAERNWDLLIHSYEPVSDWKPEEGVEVFHSSGQETISPKMLAMHAFFQKRRDYLLSYDYVCLADDDLVATVEIMNAIFVISQHFGLDLSQPALTPDSFMAHWGITMQNRSFLLRYTNFVEVMIPVFSRSFLERCAPTFNETISSYGLDLLWSSMVTSPLKIGILDACPVRHSRPTRGGRLYKNIASLGADPDQELIALIKKYKLVPEKDQIPGRVVLPLTRVWGGILKNQERITIQEGHGVELMRQLLNGLPPEFARDRGQVINLLFPIMQQMASS
jgi:hypothetical protein